MSYLKVKGHENLYRDPNTGAIINQEKPHRNNVAEKFNSLSYDINNLKEEISVIKNLLRDLVKNGNKS